MEERRKFVRIKDLEAVEIKIKNSSGEMERVEIKDMSINGINFYSDSEIEKDKMLKL